ncbi:ShlB/FhaC/HecB family hemolysin secretion/activation protein [Iodobacter sp. HSC-16F04]|uniref:ShlB/FhaC/HecB family hemolysin secretion/activation protein n=1 Tax=Iodobacter violaceini TaxID=3044271 RepID=A0ABX0KUK2_9NEIS|nr:ShlB/FhaC/HecB family hemolysin secretion/activation protein [Iodobacter violacea]NHQ85739.1 ShlB/FhaC/HecB family hemolysin secretion/activation protein [Iodobacter violacea]
MKFRLCLLASIISGFVWAEEPLFNVSAFNVRGENPLSNDESQQLLQAYLGKNRSLSDLQQAASTFESVLRDRGHGFLRVTLPPQEVSGTITLEVLSFKLSKVSIKNNTFFDEENQRNSLPALKEDSSPNFQAMTTQLVIANENPAKQTTLTFKEGDADSIEAILDTQQQKPWSVFVSGNNSGSDDNGRLRLSLGLQHANLFNSDHVATVSYSTAPSQPDNVSQYGVFYRWPLYQLGGSLSAYYAQSKVDSGSLGEGLTITGKGESGGLRYTHYLAPQGQYRSQIEAAIDDKLFRGTDISGVGQLSPDVRSRPLTLAYNGHWQSEDIEINFGLDYTHNLPSGVGNDDEAYQANRKDAYSNWQSWHAKAEGLYRFAGDWQASLKLSGQFSNEALIAGEQFALGGNNSLRGVSDRSATGDSGVQGTIEISTPKIYEGLRLLSFIDTGAIHRRSPDAGSSSQEALSSVGLGLRWQIQDWGLISADWGYIVDGSSSPKIERGESFGHLGFYLKY